MKRDVQFVAGPDSHRYSERYTVAPGSYLSGLTQRPIFPANSIGT